MGKKTNKYLSTKSVNKKQRLVKPIKSHKLRIRNPTHDYKWKKSHSLKNKVLGQNFAQIHEEEEGKENVKLPVPKNLSPSQKNKRLNWLASIKTK